MSKQILIPWGKIYAFIDGKKLTFKNNHFFASPRSQTIIDSQVVTETMSEFKLFIEHDELVEKYSAYIQKKNNERVADSVVYETPEKLIEAFTKQKNIVVGGRGDTLKIEGQMSSLDDVFVMLRNFNDDYISQAPTDDRGRKLIETFSPRRIEDKFNEFLIRKDLDYRKQTCEKLKFDGTDADAMVMKLLKIMNINHDVVLSCDALKHWFWLVKRRLLDRPVNDEIMISIMANQGVGKSYVTQKIAEPLMDYYAETELSALADAREVGKWSKYFFINFEELSKSNGTQAQGHFTATKTEDIKKILTQNEFLVRQMRSHKQLKVQRTFTAWATTNISIADVLGDETGMRRFYQLESEQPANEQFNHDDVANFDFLVLWRSIDEDLSRGYLHPGSRSWEELKEIQKTYVPKSQIDLWLADGEFIPGDADDHDEHIAVLEMYQHFKEFTDDAGIPTSYRMGMKKFKEKIQKHLTFSGDGDGKKYYLKRRGVGDE
jgi:hypothetical protein